MLIILLDQYLSHEMRIYVIYSYSFIVKYERLHVSNYKTMKKETNAFQNIKIVKF